MNSWTYETGQAIACAPASSLPVPTARYPSASPDLTGSTQCMNPLRASSSSPMSFGMFGYTEHGELRTLSAGCGSSALLASLCNPPTETLVGLLGETADLRKTFQRWPRNSAPPGRTHDNLESQTRSGELAVHNAPKMAEVFGCLTAPWLNVLVSDR